MLPIVIGRITLRGMGRGVLVALFAGILGALFAGCAGGEPGPFDEPSTSLYETYTADNWGTLAADPKAKRGASVDIVVRVIDAQVDPNGVVIQAFIGGDSNRLVIAALPGATAAPAVDSYLKIRGTVTGVIEGANAFGGVVSGPAVVATFHDEISEMEALAPTMQTYGGGDPYGQEGVRVGISKIELADRETRVYVTVTNRSGHSFSFYSNTAKLIDNGRQLDPTYEDYGQAISTDIAPGASSQGIIVFPPISQRGKLRVILGGYTGGDYPGEVTWEWTYS